MRKFWIITLSLLVYSVSGKAQGSTDMMEWTPSHILTELSTSVDGGGEDGAGVETGPDPGSIPVDGGLGLLLAAGAAYGVRRMCLRVSDTPD